ncbi:hypothetical protein ANI02nite_36400 [Acetobacter nitrogenifigens DSM 23921 = NBRC 105050]|uniref:Uncharacterized protein n=2 Tax=Acetobacter nitrogenifigens TaxID=285268 RepID=A0A511XFL8_9PROT|nr:hypothetical protein [Acetobacter nitrogenifigens]GEN61756.1 hypothetical protein ANI02nite_36400 [Acetobacter nitrogenifigens DSM 23921 = NBRC 105050]
MAHGGARPGAGRKPGSRNKKELNWNGKLLVDLEELVSPNSDIVDPLTGMTVAELAGVSPLLFLARIYRNRGLSPVVRTDAAKAALSYSHARLSAPKSEQASFFQSDSSDGDWEEDLPPVSKRN